MNPRAPGARMVWEGPPAMPISQLFLRTSGSTSHRPEPTAGAAASAEAGGSVPRSASQTLGFRRDAPGLAHPWGPLERRGTLETHSAVMQYTGSASSPLPDSWLLDVTWEVSGHTPSIPNLRRETRVAVITARLRPGARKHYARSWPAG